MIFFDIDRTLFDYDHAVDSAMDDFFLEFGHETPYDLAGFKERWVELYEQYWSAYELGTMSLKEQRILRMQGLFEDKQISTVQAEKFAGFHNDSYVSHWRLFPDAVDLLDHLKGRTLGIISNGNAERQRAKLERTSIVDRFDPIVISGAYGYAKPDIRIFETACELARVVPSDATHIGDNLIADIEGAAGAGLSPIWINRFEPREGDFSNGSTSAVTYLTIHQLSELIDQFD